MRGYNLSDKPQGREHYLVDDMTDDVAALVEALGHKRCLPCPALTLPRAELMTRCHMHASAYRHVNITCLCDSSR